MPEQNLLIAGIVHKFEIFGIGDQLIGKGKFVEIDLVLPHFIIISKSVRPMFKTDLINPFGNRAPTLLKILEGSFGKGFVIGWEKRIVPQNIFDVIQQEFLMLLLMVNSYFNNHAKFRRDFAFSKILHPGGNVVAVCLDLIDRRPGEVSAFIAKNVRSHTFIIAIENKSKVF